MKLIEQLWHAFDDNPDDLARLLIIADAYEEDGESEKAVLLRQWFSIGRKPTKPRKGTVDYFCDIGYRWWVSGGDPVHHITVDTYLLLQKINYSKAVDGTQTASESYLFLMQAILGQYATH